MQMEFILGRRLGMSRGIQETLCLPTPSQSLTRQIARIHTQDFQIGGESFTDGTASLMGQPLDLLPLARWVWGVIISHRSYCHHHLPMTPHLQQAGVRVDGISVGLHLEPLMKLGAAQTRESPFLSNTGEFLSLGFAVRLICIFSITGKPIGGTQRDLNN